MNNISRAGDFGAGEQLSTFSDPLNNLAAGTSSEFDRLMQDSVDSAVPPVVVQMAKQPAVARPAQTVPSQLEPFDSPYRQLQRPQMPPQHEQATPRSPLPSHRTFASASASGGAAVPEAPPSDDPEDRWVSLQLSGRLDGICQELKRCVEHEYNAAERALAGRHRALLEAQQMKAEAALCHQNGIIDGLQSEKYALLDRIEVQQRRLNRYPTVMQRSRGTLSGRCALVKSFAAWKAAAVEEKGDRLQRLLHDKFRGLRLLAFAVGTWRRNTHCAWRERIVAHERAAADTLRSKLFDQMEVERKSMCDEIENLNKKLVEEARQRCLLQDNLKRVFMRGVCALNFEAMSLLSDGAVAEPPPVATLVPPPSTELDRNGFEAAECQGSGPLRPAPRQGETSGTVTAVAQVSAQGYPTGESGLETVASPSSVPHTHARKLAQSPEQSQEQVEGALARNSACCCFCGSFDMAANSNSCQACALQRRQPVREPTLEPAAGPLSRGPPFAVSAAASPTSSWGGTSHPEIPRQSPEPLPFVSYVGQSERDLTSKEHHQGGTSRFAAGSHGGPLPKGLRWQQAAVPSSGSTGAGALRGSADRTPSRRAAAMG
eukprot:TRINITY_DN75204_c0_g1_i1.p1 TRINITY_DN75204_c0_g1~~TRINITY_DN75204_c0_g1_i1.p1  ORF type:complete len:602 (+),score=97.47 TRINITY_DN75204_c0_g1_i1:57-1862(+)